MTATRKAVNPEESRGQRVVSSAHEQADWYKQSENRKYPTSQATEGTTNGYDWYVCFGHCLLVC